MKKRTCLLLLLLSISGFIYAQSNGTNFAKKSALNETTIVRDSSGNQYAYEDWRKMLQSGDYAIKKHKSKEDNEVIYFIHRLTLDEKEAIIANKPRPLESAFFITGNKFPSFKTKDMQGTKINLKELAGKVIVLNFWFINCPPCRREIPELNSLVKSYNSDSSTVFIAIALDSYRELKEFLKEMPFEYNIVDNGKFLANRYGVKAFPTNVVVDRQGIIRFHSSGYSTATVHWIKKTIEEAKAAN
jgi:peroxiredoxin